MKMSGKCEFCKQAIPICARADSKFCSRKCRQSRFRERSGIAARNRQERKRIKLEVFEASWPLAVSEESDVNGVTPPPRYRAVAPG
jgi:hypothetical protein